MRRLPGIIEVNAIYQEGKAVVRYDPALVSPAEMADAITAATYYSVGEPVIGGEIPGAEKATKGATAVIRVEGMSDERAASLVTQAMGAVGPGVLDVSLDVPRSTLMVRYDDKQVSAQALVDAVKRGSGLESSLVSSTFAKADGGVDYTPYIVIGISAVFVAVLGWYGFSWGRRRLVRAFTAERSGRRRRGRGRRSR